MPESISRDQAHHTLLRMGYVVHAEEGGFVLYIDERYPQHPLKFDFGSGDIPWHDFQEQLEYEGVNVDVFIAEQESMG